MKENWKEYIQFDAFGKAYLQIKVIPRQSKTEFFSVMDDGTVKIRVNAVAEKNKANETLLRFLAQELALKTEDFCIISGKTDTKKLIRINMPKKIT